MSYLILCILPFILQLKDVIDHNPSLSEYRSISKKNLYKCFVDQERWKKADKKLYPALIFDHEEPGYLKGMTRAFIYMIDHLEYPLSSQMIETLHDLAIDSVFHKKRKAFFLKGFRQGEDSQTFFGLIPFKTVSIQGKQELFDKWKEEPSIYSISLMSDTQLQNLFQILIQNPRSTIILPKIRWISLKPVLGERTLALCIDHLINLYYEEINQGGDRLIAIIRLIQNLEQIHPFYDGNIRTFGILLLNKLLLENGLEPCCLANPNCIDCLSLEEIKQKVLEGQEFFRSLKTADL